MRVWPLESPSSTSEGEWDNARIALARQVSEGNRFREVAGVVVRADWATRTAIVAGVMVSTSNWKPVSTKRIETPITLEPPQWPPRPKHEGLTLGPCIAALLTEWVAKPDMLFVDGHGMASYGLGLASVVGLSVNVPCVGVARLFPRSCTQVPNRFPPTATRGARIALRDEQSNKHVGYALKIQPNEDPRYISPGNNVSVEDAAHLTLRASPWYPEPEPLRAARELLDG